MASQFIGLTILLTLNDPDRTRLRGLVAKVIGQELTLDNVLFVDAGYSVPSYTVNGLSIADIEIASSEPTPPPPSSQTYAQASHIPLHAPPLVVHTPPIPSVPQMYPTGVQFMTPPRGQHYSYPSTMVNPAQSQVVASSQFIDPAILSISQKPLTPSAATQAPPSAQHMPKQPNFSTPPRVTATVVSSTAAAATQPLNIPILKRQGSSHGSNLSLKTLGVTAALKVHPYSANAAIESRSTGLGQSSQSCAPSSATATLDGPFGDLSIKGDVAAESSAFDETDDNLSSVAMPPTPDVRQKFQGKRSRRGKSHLKRQHEQQRQLLEPIVQGSNPHGNVVAPGMFGGSIAQPASAGAHHLVQPGMSGKRRRPRRNNRYDGNTTNAEEEGWATEDVNDYKEREFDFQGNLDKFDKKTVFTQIKAEDTTAEGDRLVSFNRLPQRNPSSKSSGVARKNYHHSENVLGNYANGQSLTERDGWNSPEFIAEESESSEDSDHHARGRGDGGAADSGRSSRRAKSRQESRRRSTRQLSTSNPAAMRSLENLQYAQSSSGGGAGPSAPGVKSSKATLRLAPSHRPCPVVSPLQMLDVERIAEVELCLTDDMMTENAGRGIAQVAIQAFGKRISATNHNALPVVLVFAGNHKSGARAIAAGRHLKNHHVRVMVCVLGLEREDELLEHVRRQLNIFRNAGGRVARWEELASNLKTLDSPPELIIDGLLGTHLSIEDLRTDQQATAFELVQFANKSKASVLAVDIPSGVDGSTGEVAQLEDTGSFHMKAKWVVCMGAPKSGLLNALVSGVGTGWNLYVADIGISNTAWRKYGTRRRHGVEFAADWVVTLEYHGGS